MNSRHCPNICMHFPGECWGGGNKECFQRDPQPSIIAAIVDSYGGVRTVITHKDHLKYHVRQGELAVIVPKLTVHEPIAWGDIPFVIARAKLELDKWIEQRGIPNDPEQRECVVWYKMNQTLHHSRRGSRDLSRIAYT